MGGKDERTDTECDKQKTGSKLSRHLILPADWPDSVFFLTVHWLGGKSAKGKISALHKQQ